MLLAARKREELILAGQLALAVVIPSALAFPYLRQVGESESSDGWMGLTDSAGLLAMKAANLAFFLFAFALLAYLHRAELMRMIGERNRAVIMLLLAVAALGTAFLVVRTPDMNEYKFLLQIAPAAAAIMALSLRERLRNHRAIALVLVFLLVSPGCRTLAFRLGFGVTDPVRIEGRYQRALYPAADTLYQWVAAHTPIDAVFIARDLRMPALGRRPIYIAVNAPWRGPDGWGRSRSQLLQWHVRRSDTATKRRQQLAGAILSPTWTIPPDSVMSAIQADIPGRPIFVHADVPDVAAKLDTTPGFVRQFRNPIGSIYSYTNRSPMPVTDTR
jgi:hypothetical protein